MKIARCGPVDNSNISDKICNALRAGVAELADALGSGLSERKLVRVQVPPSALLVQGKNSLKGGFLFAIHPHFSMENCMDTT